MPRNKTTIELLEVDSDEVTEDVIYRPVANTPEAGFPSLAAARKWMKDNCESPVSYYPVRVGAPIKVTIETVKKVV